MKPSADNRVVNSRTLKQQLSKAKYPRGVTEARVKRVIRSMASLVRQRMHSA